MKISFLGSVLLGTLFMAIPAFANIDDCYSAPGNLVANCGFENGVYTSGGDANVPNSWSSNAAFDNDAGFNQVRSAPVYQGSYALSIGNFDGDPVPKLSQTLADTSGIQYSGSLFVDYGGCCGDANAFFQTQINGTPVVSLSGSMAPGSYTEYTFSFVGTGSDVLTLAGNTNPSEWFVDDITVASATTPEPALYLPLVIMLAALYGGEARRRSANAHKA